MSKRIRVVAADQCGWFVQDSSVVPYVFEDSVPFPNIPRTNAIHRVTVSRFSHARKSALVLSFDMPGGETDSLQYIFDGTVHKNFIRGLSYATACFLLFTEENELTPTLNTFHRYGIGFSIRKPISHLEENHSNWEPFYNEFRFANQVPI